MGAFAVVPLAAQEEADGMVDNCCNCLIVCACGALCLMGHLAINILALVIAFDFFDENECESDIGINPDSFLIIGSFLSLGFMVFSCSTITCFIKRDPYNRKGKDEIRCNLKWPIMILMLMFGLFFVSWSIMSFIMYANFNSDCKASLFGGVLLSWGIIQIVLSPLTAFRALVRYSQIG